MSLKLFRSTGFHSILAPGETRVALHPALALFGVSLWIGLACNAWLWMALVQGEPMLGPLLVGLTVAAVVATVLSLLGWRRTFKPVATFLLLLAALLAGGIWTQAVALSAVMEGRPFSTLFPTWAALFGWHVPTLLALLGGVPVLWLWNTQLRRLSGPAQSRANFTGLFLYGPVAFGLYWLLTRLPA